MISLSGSVFSQLSVPVSFSLIDLEENWQSLNGHPLDALRFGYGTRKTLYSRCGFVQTSFPLLFLLLNLYLKLLLFNEHRKIRSTGLRNK